MDTHVVSDDVDQNTVLSVLACTDEKYPYGYPDSSTGLSDAVVSEAPGTWVSTLLR
jgi:hypothetical protein